MVFKMRARVLLRVKSGEAKEADIGSCHFSRICPIYSPGRNGKCVNRREKRCKEFIKVMITSEF